MRILLIFLLFFAAEMASAETALPVLVSCQDAVYQARQYSPRPVYPHKLKGKKVFGVVRFSLSIGADGAVKEVKIESSPHKLFTKSVITAVMQWNVGPCSLPTGKDVIWFKSSVTFNEWYP